MLEIARFQLAKTPALLQPVIKLRNGGAARRLKPANDQGGWEGQAGTEHGHMDAFRDPSVPPSIQPFSPCLPPEGWCPGCVIPRRLRRGPNQQANLLFPAIRPPVSCLLLPRPRGVVPTSPLAWHISGDATTHRMYAHLRLTSSHTTRSDVHRRTTRVIT